MTFGNRFSPRAILILAAFLLSPIGGRVAEAQSWDLPQLMHDFAQIKTSRAQFTEHKYLHMLKKPLEDHGFLLYEAPSRLQKQTVAPKLERMVIDGDTIEIARDNKIQTMTRNDYPQIWAFIEGIRATLAGDRSALEKVYTTQLDGDKANWQLSLQPRDPQMQQILQLIRISGSGTHISKIETEEHDGDRTEMTITEDVR